MGVYFVYIIYSESCDQYYKGSTSRPERRLERHNLGQTKSTRGKGPWVYVYLREMVSKRAALIEERRIKKLNRASIIRMIGEGMPVIPSRGEIHYKRLKSNTINCE